MKYSISLKWLGIFVLCIPLVCQIIFSTVLYWQVRNAESAVKAEIAARGYTIDLQKLVTAMLEKLLAVRLEKNSTSLFAEATTTSTIDRTTRKVFQYQSLSPEARKRLQSILAHQKKLEEDMKQLSFSDSQKDANAEVQKATVQIFADINMVANEVIERARGTSGDTVIILAAVKQFLITGLAISSIGGICLAWLVGQLAYKPIYHILQNARAMAAQRKLVPLQLAPQELLEIDSALLHIASTLATASSRQHNLYELSPAFLLEVSPSGKIVKGNITVSNWLAQGMPDLIDQNLFGFFSGTVRLRLESQVEMARETGARKVFQLDTQNLLSVPDHTQWTVNWNEQSQSYFCVAHDITDSTNVERLRDQISRYLTLELGSPLKTISSLISQAKQIAATKPAQDTWSNKQLAVIASNVERLSNLLNQLDQSTDPTKLEIAVSQGMCSNKTVISRSIEAVRSLAQAKGVQIVSKVDWSMVRGTESELERVLINLISNAIKFTPEGSRIEVASRPYKVNSFLPQGNQVIFSVLDQGSGIPAQSRQEIFAPFKQLDNSKTSTPSTGLGLSVCKTIVERAGGKIWVDNGAEGGASFNFLLPTGTDSADRLLD